MPELGCCLSITGCVFYQLSHRLYLAAQLISSKATLVPSMSANGCLAAVSLMPSLKLSSVTDPFLMPDDLKAGRKGRRMFFPLKINMSLTFLPSILGEASLLTSLAVFALPHTCLFIFPSPYPPPSIFTTAWLEFSMSSFQSSCVNVH